MAIVDNLIIKYKNRKKLSFLKQPLYQSRKKYAFVGVGMHSLANLYPILHYFNISLKYIHTHSQSSAGEMASRYPGSHPAAHMDTILHDPEIAGVFVCTRPALHFSLAKQLLAAGKHVFVEKPPCFSRQQLDELIQGKKELNCFVDLQKRFGTINRLLVNKIKQTSHYHCKYLVGPYPEGNPVYELFIHPVDNCVQLFGNAGIRFIKNSSSNRSSEFLLILEHGRTTGIIELSTGHSWNNPVDSLVINTDDELFTVRYPNFVQGEEKSKTFAGIPLEKIGNRPQVTRTYLNNDGVIPSMENGSLFIQGFYGAVGNFIQSVEKNTASKECQPESLSNVYEILDALNNAGIENNTASKKS
jgi:virulence factor